MIGAGADLALWKAAWRLKWHRFLWCGALLLIGVEGAYLLLAAGILRGGLTRTPVLMLSTLIICLALLVGMGLSIFVLAARRQETPDLARLVEAGEPLLLDRLNTIVHLESRPYRYRSESYLRRIREQAQEVLSMSPPRLPSMPARTAAALLASVLLAGFTVLLYGRLGIWHRVPPDPRPERAGRNAEPKLPAGAPDANALESARIWGEVRIVEPGHDLKVTKVDAVPLQIEAASSQPLGGVQWFTAVNGGDEHPRNLPLAAEARYAVYEPVLYLEEQKLSDWDVLSYGARASTQKGEKFASELYFVEIRPFREEIQKLPGGEGGRAAQTLNKLSGLIARQEQLLRDTHRHEALPEGEAKAEDRGRLSKEEAELGDATEHLYAEIASEMENQAIGEVLDHLAGAEEWEGKASGSLKKLDALDGAKKEERSALKELVATRKGFHKFVTENPKAYSDGESETAQTAELTDRLNEMAEFRNEARAAQDLVDRALAKQRDVAKRAERAPRSEQPKLADEEKALAESLEGFADRYPRSFRQVAGESSEARKALEDAAGALGSQSGNARRAPKEATAKLEELSKALSGKSLGRELAGAYGLKRVLDQKAGEFERLQKDPSSASGAPLRKSVDEARRAVAELKRVADEKPTSDAFGPDLREALGDGTSGEGGGAGAIDATLETLARAPGPEARSAAAGASAQALRDVGKAFEKSQPPTLREARKGSTPEQAGDDALQKGLAQLRSLLTEAEQGHLPASAEERKLRREALQNLLSAVRSTHGRDRKTDELIVLMEEALKDKAGPLDLALLKKLTQELQRYSAEVRDRRDGKPKDAVVTNLEPSRLPPAYRARIQTYFKKLSEE